MEGHKCQVLPFASLTRRTIQLTARIRGRHFKRALEWKAEFIGARDKTWPRILDRLAVRTVWIVEADSPARLVTAYPA